MKYKNEPFVSVGIVTAQRIQFRLNALYRCVNAAIRPQDTETVEATPTGIRWRGHIYHQLAFTPEEASFASFSLFGVTIGVGFHWQRQEEQTFRGSLSFLSREGMVTAVNTLPVEDYLASVISSEMSSAAPLEFLKAHAVISRSWLLAQIERKDRREQACHEIRRSRLLLRWYDHDDHTLYDVCADDHCQRYQGLGKMMGGQALEAIRQTRGQVLTFGGCICDTRFSKCCGGTLELFSSCWEDIDHPYLVSKPDLLTDERARGVEDAFCRMATPEILAQVLNNFDQETPDFYRWTVSYTQQELSLLVCRKSGIDFGKILDLRPLRRGPSGRIIELEIVGTHQTLVIGKELEIRRWLSPSHLYSSAFDVERTADGGFLLHGKGWGHGVGLCQIGAAVMGTLAYSHEEILQHYYPGAALTRWYGEKTAQF